MTVIAGDEVVIMDKDRRRGVVQFVDLSRQPGPTIRVRFDDGKLPDTGYYYESNLTRIRP